MSRLPRRGVVIVALLAVAVAATTYVAYHVTAGKSSGLSYPDELPGGYSVVKVVSGREALALVKGLHWNPSAVEASEAVIVVYSDGTRAWIVRTMGDACSYVDRMAKKMAIYTSQLPYTPPVPHLIADTKVYLTLDRRSQRLHAFWCRSDLAVWVELGASGINGLEELVKEIG